MPAALALGVASGAAAELRAGFGRAPITPAVPDTWTDVDGDGLYEEGIDRFEDRDANGRFDAVYMAGFQNPRPAAGVHDELLAVAAVFDDGETRVGIVTADVVGLSHSFVESVRAAHAKALALDYLLVHATHNHQGPDTQGLWGPGRFTSGIGAGYHDFLRARLGDALHEAVAALAPAAIEIAEITGRDRRIGTVDTRGPQVIDDGIRVAIVTRACARAPGSGATSRGSAEARSAAGCSPEATGSASTVPEAPNHVLGTLVNFGNHVELLWDRNFQLSADVAGYARRGLERGLDYDGQLYAPGLGGTTLWLTGNIGGLITTLPEIAVPDVRSGEPVRAPSFEKARAQGYAIAQAVLETRTTGGFRAAVSPRIRVHAKDLRVPLANWPLALVGALGVLDRDFDVGFGFETESEVALVEVGPLWIACVPGELYPEIAVGGIENPPGADFATAPVETPPLRSAMRGSVNMMVNLANDALGYIIPKSEWDAEAPYLYGASEDSYGEIVSAGPETAAIVHGALMELFAAATREAEAAKR